MLQARPGKDLWLFGGGELLKSFLDLRLVGLYERTGTLLVDYAVE